MEDVVGSFKIASLELQVYYAFLINLLINKYDSGLGHSCCMVLYQGVRRTSSHQAARPAIYRGSSDNGMEIEASIWSLSF